LLGTLRLVGADATDDPGRDRTLCEVTNQVWLALTADLAPISDGVWRESEEGWFGVSADFQPASDLYINPTGPLTIVAWLAPPTASGTMRKRIINTSDTYDLYMSNTVGGTTPGFLMGRARKLAPGEACRAAWDPTGQRWLINDGLQSANYVTSLNELVTVDDEIITVAI
jgi:hypothetical protein